MTKKTNQDTIAMHCMTMNISSRRELQTVLALLPSTQFSDDFPFLDQLRMFAGPPLGVALGPSGLPISILSSKKFQERGREGWSAETRN